MSFKIRLPDDNLLEIDVRKDDTVEDAVPLDEVVDEREPELDGGRNWPRRLAGLAAIGLATAGGAFAVKRYLGRRSADSTEIEVERERTTSS